MSTANKLLETARARKNETKMPYAGALTPHESYTLLHTDPNVKLVDVRTDAERDWIGRVDIPQNQHLAVQWNLYPEGKPNPDFLQQLSEITDKANVLLFMCRSGVRSRHSATLAAEHGYINCFDVLEGFEGEKDADGHRKNINGWCKAKLPWTGA